MLMPFGAKYWDAMGGWNSTSVNDNVHNNVHKRLTFSGDVYIYLVDQAATGADKLADIRRTVQDVENDGPAIPSPFYHPKRIPEKMDTMIVLALTEQRAVDGQREWRLDQLWRKIVELGAVILRRQGEMRGAERGRCRAWKRWSIRRECCSVSAGMVHKN
jgi:hypothetical protein